MTSRPQDVGILALEVYFPNQVDLEKYDGVGAGKYTIGLGQTRMSFCDDREDMNSLALTTVSSLMRKYAIDPSSVGRLEVGTETVLDKSKSCKSVLMQLFEPLGNTDIEGVDNLNACYGGTNALFNALNWVESSGWDGRNAIVVAGDIALYNQINARPTGGAGCVAMLIGPDAPLSFDPGLRGTCIRHTYDFYKPNFRAEYPYVEGQLSIKCYLDAMDSCYETYHAKKATLAKFRQTGAFNGAADTASGMVANGVVNNATSKVSTNLPLDDFDYMVFHSPTCKLVSKAYGRLLYNDYLANPSHPDFISVPVEILKVPRDKSFADKTIEKVFMGLAKHRFEQRVQPSIQMPTLCGNMYCASVYGALISLICGVDSPTLQGKRVGVYSYGGGLAASFFSLKIRRDVVGIAKRINLQARLDARISVSPEQYLEACKLREDTYGQKAYTPKGDTSKIVTGTYHLTEVDDLYQRKYTIKV
ncbi:MAG: hypothetical protein Q9164_006445 [Protoblastenia rupestris]